MEEKKAYLYSACPPTEKQTVGFRCFIEKKYGEGYELIWQESDKYAGRFALRVASDLYDWSAEARIRQLTATLLTKKGLPA